MSIIKGHLFKYRIFHALLSALVSYLYKMKFEAALLVLFLTIDWVSAQSLMRFTLVGGGYPKSVKPHLRSISALVNGGLAVKPIQQENASEKFNITFYNQVLGQPYTAENDQSIMLALSYDGGKSWQKITNYAQIFPGILFVSLLKMLTSLALNINTTINF